MHEPHPLQPSGPSRAPKDSPAATTPELFASRLQSWGDPRLLSESERFCESLTRDRARNFFHGIRLTPRSKRKAMYAIYAWTRLADDIADSTPSADSQNTLRDLDTFQSLTNMALADSYETTAFDDPSWSSSQILKSTLPIWPALTHAIKMFQPDADDFDLMIAGQRSDVSICRRQTWGELYEYCDQVASTVGRMCLAIWGYDSRSDALQLAHWRGIALQLTNIIRDVHEDYQNDRVYFPADELASFDITAETLITWAKPSACNDFMRMQIERAYSYYAKSESLDSLITPDCTATSLGIVNLYKTLLDEISKRPQEAATGTRISLSKKQKMKVLATSIRSRLRPRSAPRLEQP